MYLVTFGLGPYLEHCLLDMVQQSNVKNIVILFDESHNKSLEKKQVDVHFRFWDYTKNSVVTKYLTSEFIGHGRAEDLLPVLMKCISTVGTHKITQMSMDGHSVN